MPFQEYHKEDFEIDGANGKLISGDITYANEYPNYIVIFVHGFKGFKDWGAHHLVAEYFANKGMYFAKFNFSHSGVQTKDLSDITDLKLFSENTPSKELFDLNEVINFIVNKFPYLKIVLLGHSRGGALSILQAAKDKRIFKLITWAAIASFRNLWPIEEEEEWKRKGVRHILNGRTKELMPLSVSLLEDVLKNEKEFDLTIAAKKIICSWLIVQGSNDPAVKPEVATFFHHLQPKNSELLVIDQGDHVFGAKHPFLEENLPYDLEKFCDACFSFLNC